MSRPRGLLLASLGTCVLAASAGLAQRFPWESDNKAAESKVPATVTFLGPEQVSIPAKRAAVLDLHFRVAPGFHINSHAPYSKTLIPTQLVVADEVGLSTTAVDFPGGSDYSFAFALDQKLSVYTGDVTLQAHVTAQPGMHLLQGYLRYQACDANACMPPKKIPVAVSLSVQ